MSFIDFSSQAPLPSHSVNCSINIENIMIASRKPLTGLVVAKRSKADISGAKALREKKKRQPCHI